MGDVIKDCRFEVGDRVRHPPGFEQTGDRVGTVIEIADEIAVEWDEYVSEDDRIWSFPPVALVEADA